MITFSKSEVKDLDRLLEYLFTKQNKYSVLEDSSTINLNQISVTRKELQKHLSFNDLQLSKYVQILLARNKKDDIKFIKVDQSIDKIWLMDHGIEFYYLGGFKRERKGQLTKRRYETASIIFGIVASLGVILSIYLNVIDTKRIDQRIDKIEQDLSAKSN